MKRKKAVFCRQFYCPERRGGRCCADCERREVCDDPCLNAPERCGLAAEREGQARSTAWPYWEERRVNKKVPEGEAARLHDQGKTDGEIAGALGVSVGAVWSWRQRTGRKNNGKGPGWIDWKRGLEMYRQGKSDGAIARALGCSRQAVMLWRKKEGLPAGVRPQRERR